jgi:hypothetical protein
MLTRRILELLKDPLICAGDRSNGGINWFPQTPHSLVKLYSGQLFVVLDGIDNRQNILAQWQLGDFLLSDTQKIFIIQ